MTEPVNARSGRRERKARETRRRILDAAETLFVDAGYAATTITAIADAADVAVQTVYAIFGTKRAILAELLAHRTVGDDQTRALSDRQDWKAMERELDPRRQLRLLAAIATDVGVRIAALTEVLAAAAGADPDIAVMFEDRKRARYDDQRRVARSLARRNELRVGLSEAHATDIIWTVANPRTMHALVTERRWAIREYEAWLGQALASLLLAEAAQGSTRSGSHDA
jgi:AcrR family transcriptional regulator